MLDNPNDAVNVFVNAGVGHSADGAPLLKYKQQLLDASDIPWQVRTCAASIAGSLSSA